ncbi:MAG: mechanosensitive ion channel domain-containing protein [Patescibacteria group bacterium]
MGLTSFIDRIIEIAAAAWDKLPQILLTLVIGFILIKLIKALLHGVIRVSRANQALKGVLMSVVDVALWILVLAAIFQQIGLGQVALALSGTVAIAGIAVSIGSSVFIQDMVAGVFLAQDPDFKVGDTIEHNGVEGIVEKMDARKVRLRDKGGDLHVYPNSSFDKEPWIALAEKDKGGR